MAKLCNRIVKRGLALKVLGIVLVILGILTITTSIVLGLILIVIGTILLLECVKKQSKVSVSMSYVPLTVNSKTKKKRASKLPKIGNIEAICPYCNQSLENKPGRKKKCPNCGKFIYVRTRPNDNQKVLVTLEQIEMIEEQWAIVNGTHEEYIVSRESKKRIVEGERLELEKRFGRKPSDNDIQWSLLNKDLLVNAKNRDWGLYRNTKFSMGEILRKESKNKSALLTYFEVCYLDLNGPNNVGCLIDSPELVKTFPEWDPKDLGLLAPGITSRACNMIEKLGLDRSSSQELFMSRAIKLHKTLKLPISPQNAWKKLANELFNK